MVGNGVTDVRGWNFPPKSIENCKCEELGSFILLRVDYRTVDYISAKVVFNGWFSFVPDVHGRIKSERNGKDLDDEDMVDDDRKDDILGNHMHHILGNGFGLKPEMKSSDCGVPLPPSKPKIWSLADTAACKTPPPPPPAQQQQWLGSNGFALPNSRYGGGNFLPSHCQQGFPDVQTDTPPQTPPSMKLPSVAGNLLPGQGSCIGGSTAGNGGYSSQSNFLGGFSRIQSPQRPQVPQSNQMSANSSENAAFKPFYKR